jgi:hypothetical protein
MGEQEAGYLCGGRCSLSRGLNTLGVDVFVLLAWAVNGDLDCNLSALDLLAIHLRASLLLKLLRRKGNETESTTFARFVAGLEFLDHETRNRAKRDLCPCRVEVFEDFQEL